MREGGRGEDDRTRLGGRCKVEESRVAFIAFLEELEAAASSRRRLTETCLRRPFCRGIRGVKARAL